MEFITLLIPLNALRIINLAVFTSLAGIATWWWWPLGPAAQNKATHPLATVRSEEPLTLADAPPLVAAPVAGMVDPQAELSTAIPDMLRILGRGDFFALLQTYAPPGELARIPEEERTAMLRAIQAGDPGIQQQMRSMIAALQSIQNATPTLDATGERATYTPAVNLNPNAVGNPRDLTFVKVKGRWYLRN
ncbi:MAG: hypothetical protein WCL04_05250 [Verrucomicrobiota bacterium]